MSRVVNLRLHSCPFCRGPQGSFAQEVGLLALIGVAGVAGWVTQSVTVTASVFLGILGMWMVYTLPAYVEQLKAAKKKKPLSPAAEAPAKLPPPEEALALIKKRRAIFPKDYNGQKVTKAEIRQMLEAARWAPTHGLTEPWR